MINPEKIQQFQQVFNQSSSVVVLLPSEPTLDQVASGLALYAVAGSLGKEVTIATPDRGVLQAFDLLQTDHITTELGKRDLCISFDFKPESIDKVSYNIDETNQKFYLLVKPKKGQKPLETESVQFSYVGADADMIVLIGIHNYEALEQLYFGYEQLFQTAQVVVLHTFEPEVGTVKIDASGHSCLSEAMTHLIAGIDVALPPEAATNLLTAIEVSTDGLTSLSITADTFECLAFLLRSGAFRKRRKPNRAELSATTQALPRNIKSNTSQKKATNGDKSLRATPKNGKKAPSELGGLDYQPSEFSPGAKA